MPNTIIVNFTPCIPAPAGGYAVRYRIVGETDYTEVGPFTESPAVFEVPGEPGTCYEGALFSDCGGGKTGDLLGWAACADSESASSAPPPDQPLAGQVSNSVPAVTINSLTINGNAVSYISGTDFPIPSFAVGNFETMENDLNCTVIVNITGGVFTQVYFQDSSGLAFGQTLLYVGPGNYTFTGRLLMPGGSSPWLCQVN